MAGIGYAGPLIIHQGDAIERYKSQLEVEREIENVVSFVS